MGGAEIVTSKGKRGILQRAKEETAFQATDRLSGGVLRASMTLSPD